MIFPEKTLNESYISSKDSSIFEHCVKNILKNLDTSLIKQQHSLNKTSRLVSMKKFLEDNLIEKLVEL